MREIDRSLRRLKLSDLRMLQAVVERGGMGKAAGYLNLSQPAVSKAIGALERELGVRLLDRSPAGVQPTVYGQAMLTGGIAVFDALKQSLSRIQFLQDPNAGELRIGCTEAGAASFVPAVIDSFSRQRPRVTFAVTVADPVTLVERDLTRRSIDLAIGAIVDETSTDEVEIIRLFTDRHVVMASRDSKWARRRKIDLVELANEMWILPLSGSPPAHLIDEAFRAVGVEPPRRRVATFSIPLGLHLLAKGRYVVMMPEVMARLSPHLPFKVLPVAFAPIPRPVSIVTLKGRTLAPLTSLFIDCAREVAAGLHQ